MIRSETEEDGEDAWAVSKHAPSMGRVSSFLQALSNPDPDGRVLKQCTGTYIALALCILCTVILMQIIGCGHRKCQVFHVQVCIAES